MRLYCIPRATGIDSLTLAEAGIPQPQRGQALVKMHAASLNYRDLMIVNGRAARGAPPADLVPLSDGAARSWPSALT
jgi:NADPH:quinone reductase-like Zn-dependent oxidoreductase